MNFYFRNPYLPIQSPCPLRALRSRIGYSIAYLVDVFLFQGSADGADEELSGALHQREVGVDTQLRILRFVHEQTLQLRTLQPKRVAVKVVFNCNKC